MTTMINRMELGSKIVEIHHNPSLTKKPYLIRVFSYTNFDPEELRLDEKEIKTYTEHLKKEI